MILSKTPRQPIIFNINQIKIKEPQNVVLLGATTDNRLALKDHINILYSSVNYEFHALRRIRKYLTL